jgi:hypothetical protein
MPYVIMAGCAATRIGGLPGRAPIVAGNEALEVCHEARLAPVRAPHLGDEHVPGTSERGALVACLRVVSSKCPRAAP